MNDFDIVAALSQQLSCSHIIKLFEQRIQQIVLQAKEPCNARKEINNQLEN